MIYKIRLFFLSFLMSLGVMRPGVKITNSLKTLSFSSLYLTGETNEFCYEVYCRTGPSVNIQILIANDLYPSGKVIFEEQFNSSTSGTFVYDNKYTRNNNEIIINQTIGTTNKTTSQQVSIAKTSTNRIEEAGYTYISNSYLYKYTSAKGWSISNESIEFMNFDEYYIPDFYHKFDPREFRISVINLNSNEFNFKSGMLTVTNYHGAFNSFSKRSEILIPIILVEEDIGEFHLDFIEPLYVNKVTLEMSMSKKSDLVATHCLYFPRNQKQNEEEFDIKLVLEGMGVDYSTFLINFKYKSINNIFGDCRNSEYCIVNS